jgi:hypothetical protein
MIFSPSWKGVWVAAQSRERLRRCQVSLRAMVGKGDWELGI